MCCVKFRSGIADISTRAPQGWFETITANCRPQPAIPAVLVFMLTLLLAMSVGRESSETSWTVWLIPLGIFASAGLAVGAGFCSLFPQAVWLLLAVWAIPIMAQSPPMLYVLYAGMAAVIVMFGVQIWRIKTARFVPTIELPDFE